MRSRSEDPIELELVQQPDEETELFVQPDGSIVRGSDMEEETPSKFGENLAEVLDDRELNTIAAEVVLARMLLMESPLLSTTVTPDRGR